MACWGRADLARCGVDPRGGAARQPLAGEEAARQVNAARQLPSGVEEPPRAATRERDGQGRAIEMHAVIAQHRSSKRDSRALKRERERERERERDRESRQSEGETSMPQIPGCLSRDGRLCRLCLPTRESLHPPACPNAVVFDYAVQQETERSAPLSTSLSLTTRCNGLRSDAVLVVHGSVTCRVIPVHHVGRDRTVSDSLASYLQRVEGPRCGRGMLQGLGDRRLGGP